MSTPGFGPSVKLVTIGVDAQGNPTATPTDLDIWSTMGDQVKWMGPGIPFQIIFAADSPFSQSRFNGPQASSGPIRSGASGEYKYSVQVGNKVLDPKIIVRP